MRIPTSALTSTLALSAALFVLTGCEKEQPPTPVQPAPTITNAPAPTTNLPTLEMPTAPKPTGDFITPEAAKNHIDQFRTVRGKVYGVHVSQKGDVFMDIGGARNAGLFPILLDPYDDHVGADFHRVKSLYELL